jgi:hypothetical protein
MPTDPKVVTFPAPKPKRNKSRAEYMREYRRRKKSKRSRVTAKLSRKDIALIILALDHYIAFAAEAARPKPTPWWRQWLTRSYQISVTGVSVEN